MNKNLPPQTAQMGLDFETESSAPLPTATAPIASAALRRYLVVSIHDVSPLTREATEKILAELEALGVQQVSLLVIPDHHCKGHILDDPEFCYWLRARAEAGDEVVLHGYFHRRDQRAKETFKQKLATRYYTAGEGEFYDIHGADALRLVSQARQEFRKIGLDPKGFVPPAWLLSDAADRALQRLGIAYTTRISGLYDYTSGVHHSSRSLVWSTRSLWRRSVSRFWNACLFRQLKPRGLLRISIHPPDIKHRAVWKQIKRFTAQALKDRMPVTYAGYLERT